MASDGGNPFDSIWEAIQGLQSGMEWTHVEIETLHEDVQILNNSVVELQSKVNTLEARVEELEGQMLPQGFVSVPAYDSGWTTATVGWNCFEHNLGTTEVFLHIQERGPDGNIRNYGDLIWQYLTNMYIDVYTPHGFDLRVIIWIVQEPTA